VATRPLAKVSGIVEATGRPGNSPETAPGPVTPPNPTTWRAEIGWPIASTPSAGETTVVG